MAAASPGRLIGSSLPTPAPQLSLPAFPLPPARAAARPNPTEGGWRRIETGQPGRGPGHRHSPP